MQPLIGFCLEPPDEEFPSYVERALLPLSGDLKFYFAARVFGLPNGTRVLVDLMMVAFDESGAPISAGPKSREFTVGSDGVLRVEQVIFRDRPGRLVAALSVAGQKIGEASLLLIRES